MPKIKVKNIPPNVVDRICYCHVKCKGCVLYRKMRVSNLEVGEVHCMRDPRIKPKETIVKLSEKEFPTNREWLESLSDEDLAAFYTHGVLIERYSPYPINIYHIVGSFTASEQCVKEWLSKPCLYLMEGE